jgi:RNA polymerase sigma-70 factor (ECF subfamily)
MLSFEELYVAYSPDVYRFANWLSGNSKDAEDITSETFVRAWINFDSIQTETLKAYLFTIARNLYLETLRKKHEHLELTETHTDPSPRPEKLIEHQSELDQVRNILQMLPEIDRSAFVLRVQYDLPYAEIGRVLQLSENTAKVKVHRVRKTLFTARSKEIS